MGEGKAKRPKWKTLLAMLFIVWTICLFAVGVSEKSAIPCVFGVGFAVGAAFLLKRYTPEEMAAREKEAEIKRHTNQVDKEKKLQYKQQSLERLSRTLSYTKHQSGLPLAQNVSCTLVYRGDCIDIVGGGATFRLPIEKVQGLTTVTDEEIRKQYVSSVGAAAAGAALFGPLGAMIGGRVKEKHDLTITYYLVITYLKDEQIDYISFELAGKVEDAYNFINKVHLKYSTQSRVTTL